MQRTMPNILPSINRAFMQGSNLINDSGKKNKLGRLSFVSKDNQTASRPYQTIVAPEACSVSSAKTESEQLGEPSFEFFNATQSNRDTAAKENFLVP